MKQIQNVFRAQFEAQQNVTAELRAKLDENQIMSGSWAEHVHKGQGELTQSVRQKFVEMDQQLHILYKERATDSSRRQMLDRELQALRTAKDNIVVTTEAQLQKMFEREARSSLQADLQ